VEVRALGHQGLVSELGEWSPIVNGGAWFTVDGEAVDVLFRDLDLIEGRLELARRGSFEVLAQNGYIVDAPTNLPVGELALCRHIVGSVPRPIFPPALAATAPQRSRGRAEAALMFAQGYAEAGDVVGCAGMLAAATLSTAHARVAERGEWVLTEKGLVHRAALDEVQPLFARPGTTSAELVGSVEALATTLSIKPLTPC
jgi:hypothetical protein